MNENRSPLYLLTGLILGIVAGLVFSLVISPAVYVDTAPSALSATDQDIYRSLIALAYSSDGNLERHSSACNCFRMQISARHWQNRHSGSW